MPCSAATYHSGLHKIFGVYGPQVMRFNADTGQLEARSNVVTGPCDTTCGIVYHAASGNLFVSTWNSLANQDESAAHPQSDIFPVDPSTLAIGAGLGFTTIYDDGGSGNNRWPTGARMLMDFGLPDLYFIGCLGDTNNTTWLGKIDPGSPALESIALDGLNLWSEQGCTDGTFAYFCKPFNPEIQRDEVALINNIDTVSLVAEQDIVMPISIEHATVNNKQYVVGGNQWMARIDSWGPDAYTVLNLDLVNAGSEPMRLRYRASDSKLYIPCQTTDGIIIWEPGNDGAANTTWWRGGFNSPIDVVFTNAKAFAVQNGPVSLKEITV